ncbi:efflux transporter outer membrane subunit [Shewanella sp. WXL01]|uniref:efflux transporter outer membrane subunit n=1 Tax=Shewanella sp. WXL01 TaxID=2709721 RepID=UPI0014386166|nr:efflux transporter outer membrane subunit [Shewanella sp. WXL01]NKF49375.1 efflux transporter outer membrane subunit [Shewanella sp. WXL01]
MNKRKLTLAITLLLSGCSMTPEYDVEQVISVDKVYLHQSNTTDVAASESHWWSSFNDPQLNLLIEQVQQQNLTIEVAAQRIQAAKAYQQAVSSFSIPTVSLGAGGFSYGISEKDPLLGDMVSGIQNPLNGQQLELIDKDQYGFMVGANISWEMDVFGKLDALSQAASIRLEQAEILQQGMVTLITTDLIHNYLQYRGAQERLAIAKQNIDEQQQTLEMVTSLVDAGYGSDLDLAKARAALAGVKASQVVFETAEKVHLYRIATLLGQHPSTVLDKFSAAELPVVTGKIPVGLPSDLLKRRTDIAFAERDMAAINQELGASIAAQYPSFYITASPATLAKNADDLFSSGSSAWLGFAGVTWDVFDGGRGDAMVELQQARFEQARLRYKQTVNDAFNEVETTLMTYGNSLMFHKQLAEAAEQSSKAVAKAKSLYKAGLIDYLQVLDAQRQDNQVKDAIVLAKLNVANNLLLVNKALGGDWQVPADTQTLAQAH